MDYLDYNRTVVGYHGTSAEVANALVDGEPFKESSSVSEWLGTGVYFWEYAPKQAWWWAKQGEKTNPRLIAREALMSLLKVRKESGRQAGSAKTRTSKSASATKTISSLYGTHIPEASTAKQKPTPKVAASVITGRYASVAKKIAKMSSDEVLESLLRVGVITTKGELAEKYKKKKKKKK